MADECPSILFHNRTRQILSLLSEALSIMKPTAHNRQMLSTPPVTIIDFAEELINNTPVEMEHSNCWIAPVKHVQKLLNSSSDSTAQHGSI